MSRLDDVVSDVTYVKFCLETFRDIVRSGCCNDCAKVNCQYRPKPGQLVRYNCPFHEKKNKG